MSELRAHYRVSKGGRVAEQKVKTDSLYSGVNKVPNRQAKGTRGSDVDPVSGSESGSGALD